MSTGTEKKDSAVAVFSTYRELTNQQFNKLVSLVTDLKHKHTTLIHSGEETDKAIHALALKNGYSVDVELTKENPDWEESDHVKVYDNQSLVERNRGMVEKFKSSYHSRLMQVRIVQYGKQLGML
jgi:hypothetical protein